MESKQLSALCQQTLKIAEQAGNLILEQYGRVRESDIEEKGGNSLVSYVDKEAENILVEGLSRLLPEAVFLTEEETIAQEEGEYRWIIDPLDGTTNFLHGIPFFSVSIALQKQDKLLLGIVQDVVRKENFYAWKGGGAFLNGRPIRVTNNTDLSKALIATGFPYYDFERLEKYLHVLGTLIDKTRGIRRLGSAALDLAYVACGRFDCFYEYSLNTWDIAGGAIIIEEAGGLVTDFKGSDEFITNGEIIASNKTLHKDITSIISSTFF